MISSWFFFAVDPLTLRAPMIYMSFSCLESSLTFWICSIATFISSLVKHFSEHVQPVDNLSIFFSGILTTSWSCNISSSKLTSTCSLILSSELIALTEFVPKWSSSILSNSCNNSSTWNKKNLKVAETQCSIKTIFSYPARF